jgi:transcriptional antiterminator RfaH
MIESGSRWYVVQSQPNAEHKAVAHLERQGFTTYLPRYLRRRRHARRIDIVPAALFPRYLFVGVDLERQRWRSIFSTIGVSRLVCQGEQPTPIADRVVDSLKLREDASGYVRLDYRPPFRSGDKIRILRGAFADCLGLYEDMRDSDRVAILLDLLGRKVRVTVDVDAVATA